MVFVHCVAFNAILCMQFVVVRVCSCVVEDQMKRAHFYLAPIQSTKSSSELIANSNSKQFSSSCSHSLCSFFLVLSRFATFSLTLASLRHIRVSALYPDCDVVYLVYCKLHEYFYCIQRIIRKVLNSNPRFEFKPCVLLELSF